MRREMRSRRLPPRSAEPARIETRTPRRRWPRAAAHETAAVRSDRSSRTNGAAATEYATDLPKYRRFGFGSSRLTRWTNGNDPSMRMRTHLPALEEDPVRTLVIEAFKANEIVAIECQIAVVGRAQGRGHVVRFIALQPVAGPRHIDRHRENAQNDEQDETERDRAEMARRTTCVGHADVPEVRNDKSARKTPRRCVARETSCSSTYRRSILWTKASMPNC